MKSSTSSLLYLSLLLSRVAASPTPQADDGPSKRDDGPSRIGCHGLKTGRYMAQSTLAWNIGTFCKDAWAQGIQDKDSGGISRSYNGGTMDAVNLSIDWPPGVEIPFSEDECKNQMSALSRSCDGDWRKDGNPIDWKAGGSHWVKYGKTEKHPDTEVKYNINPQAQRLQTPNTPTVSCRTWYHFLYEEVEIRGRGFASENYGRDLFNDIKGDPVDFTGWGFSYGLIKDDYEREWTANGKVPIGAGKLQLGGRLSRHLEKLGYKQSITCHPQ